MESKTKAIIFALIAIVLWGTVAAVAKLSLTIINGVQFSFYFTLFAAITIFIISLVTRTHKNIPSTVQGHWLSIILMGGLGLGCYQLFYMIAMKHAPAAQINVLNYLWPILIFVFAVVLLKEKFSWKILASFALGLLGVYIVITEGKFIALNMTYLGSYALALAGAACWALFSVYNRKKKLEPISSLFLYNSSFLILLLILMFATKSSFTIPLGDLLGAAYIGIIPTGMGYILWVKAMQEGDPAFIGNLGHLAPFLSLFFIFLILKEKILVSEIVGLVVIVLGIVLQVKFRKRTTNRNH